jgi:hypothetical protein
MQRRASRGVKKSKETTGDVSTQKSQMGLILIERNHDYFKIIDKTFKDHPCIVGTGAQNAGGVVSSPTINRG